ncbi:MAG TPA: hypothetical protein VMW70_03825 [Burkholderiales bacterium]|nr:hypothetical protein [Burkholderiales bacterium]
MKFLPIAFVLTVAGGALAGCSEVELEAGDEKRFAIVSHAGLSQPILLDQESGETWRLTEAGWQPIQALTRSGKAVDWEDLDD